MSWVITENVQRWTWAVIEELLLKKKDFNLLVLRLNTNERVNRSSPSTCFTTALSFILKEIKRSIELRKEKINFNG